MDVRELRLQEGDLASELRRFEAEADRVISSMQRSTKFARPKILREAGSQNSREEDLELDVDLDFLGSEFDK
jgi:hypothetical protein